MTNSQITGRNQRTVMKATYGENRNCTSLLPVKASLEMPESFLSFFLFFDDVKVAVTRPTSQMQPQKQEDLHLLCEPFHMSHLH